MGISSPTTSRVLNSQLESKIMSAEEAAALIRSGHQIGVSGFTRSGYPKTVPIELAHRIADAHFHGQKFQVSVVTGASTGPELDGALAMAGGIHLRLPYQSDPETRKRINAGEMDYMAIHLSHMAQFVEYGFLGMLGYMFWAAGCQGNGTGCTFPPNTCQNGMGGAATAFDIPIPMPGLRQN